MIVLPVSNSRWDEIWKECPYATYFHSREWAEIWRQYTNGRTELDGKLAVFTDSATALLPLSRSVDNHGTYTYLMSPADTYGGWLASSPLDVVQAEALKYFLTTELGNLDWQLNPFDPLLEKIDIDVQEPDQTQVLHLLCDFESVYAMWSPACRRAIRKAKKSGVTVRVAKQEEEWREFFRVYQDSLRRWGNSALCRYDWRLFAELMNRSSDRIRLWLALASNGKVIAGAILLYAQQHVVYWLGAALEECFSVRPVNLLFFHAIRDACERRIDWFDFNSSAGLEGVRRFKLGFGAEERDCSVVHVHCR